MSTFALRLDGSIELPDDDGEPAYYLRPADAFALSDFINDNREAISTAASKARTVTGYQVVAQLVASGLPVPNYTRTKYDGRIIVEFDEVAEFEAWAAAVDGKTDVDTHPTLGERASHLGEHLRIEGPWVATEPVPA